MLATLAALVVVASACSSAASPRAGCGVEPAAPPSGPPTPQVASAAPASTRAPAAVIRAWSDCFLPDTITVTSGQLVQWQSAELGFAPEIVLEDGSPVGRIQHVLEVNFSTPGAYRYHVRGLPSVGGTIVVNPRIPTSARPMDLLLY
jgi:plastocyanin